MGAIAVWHMSKGQENKGASNRKMCVFTRALLCVSMYLPTCAILSVNLSHVSPPMESLYHGGEKRDHFNSGKEMSSKKAEDCVSAVRLESTVCARACVCVYVRKRAYVYYCT
eukprot:TRINITY_DN9586_c0_g1_i1.p2 TRINITY_DN9586_c0_g1~~TRINITY_DN9586_c0_g1_i1.p2  ORF type:complete len:112 (+),score=3.27 TRINITY_DN9586_c0_g1_i1:168-503(+)